MNYLKSVNRCFPLLLTCLTNLLFLFQGTIFLGKIPKSGKPNEKSAKPKPSALKPVVTEADMSESKMEDNRESGSEHKTGANEKTEKSASQQTPQDGS